MTSIICISDTHNCLDQVDIPDGDILIHAGDATMHGTPKEFKKFNDDLGNLPHRFKVVIAGNHDKGLERKPEESRAILTNITHYLEDEMAVIEGIKIYGSPWQPRFGHGWAFNADRGENIKAKWDAIPKDTDILVTHGPPVNIGDNVGEGPWLEHVGCHDLLAATQRLKVKYHIYGHLHEGYGTRKIDDTTYINAASMNDYYKVVNKPIVFEI
jgi:Icc-related predicted phosphoesterase